MAPKRKATSSAGKSKQKKANLTGEESDENPEEQTVKNSKSSPKNKSSSDFATIDFSCNAVSKEGKRWNLKISSWNVNGLRALASKGGFDFVKHENPDIFCVQETKCSQDKLPPEAKIEGYYSYWLSGDSEGYSGVGLFTKVKPLKVSYGIGKEQHDKEGRVIVAEYEKFYLLATYTPNAGKKLVRLDYRMDWDVAYRNFAEDLEKHKPVIICGDLNVAHLDIDLANPKSNTKNAGFTPEERDGFSELLRAGFVDSFRELHPDDKAVYTFWTYMMNARAKNIGWRLDYFVISETLLPNLCEHLIRKDVMGSDHCPITLFLAL